jgi:hypothetical protein
MPSHLICLPHNPTPHKLDNIALPPPNNGKFLWWQGGWVAGPFRLGRHFLLSKL